MKIYPVEGRTVRDPHTREPVPAGGRTVSDFNTFWMRRLRDGDVTKTPSATSTPGPVAQPAAKAEAPAQEDKS